MYIYVLYNYISLHKHAVFLERSARNSLQWLVLAKNTKGPKWKDNLFLSSCTILNYLNFVHVSVLLVQQKKYVTYNIYIIYIYLTDKNRCYM